MNLRCKGKIVSIVVGESLCGAIVTLIKLLDSRTRCSCTHSQADYGHGGKIAESVLYLSVVFVHAQYRAAPEYFIIWERVQICPKSIRISWCLRMCLCVITAVYVQKNV